MSKPVLSEEAKRRCAECNASFPYYLTVCRTCGFPFCSRCRSLDAGRCQQCGPPAGEPDRRG